MKKAGNALWQSLSNKKNTTPDSVRKNYTQEGCERLAAAIVESAITDYREAGFKLKELKYKALKGMIPKGKKYAEKVQDCQKEMRQSIRFFNSQRFANLCQIDKDWLLQTLNEQIANYDPEESLRKHKNGGRRRGRI